MGLATLSPAEVEKLSQKSCIACIVKDRRVHALVEKAGSTIGSRAVNRTGVTGKGVTVAVIDTGIALHPDFAGRIAGFKDLVHGHKRPYDDNGHGTHVAGIIGASGKSSNYMYSGIAPGTRLVGVKVLDRRGFGMLSTVLMGIEWCLRNKDVFGIRIVNMSLGSPVSTSHYTDPLCMAVNKLSDVGIVVVSAAGNSGPESGTIESPGCCPKTLTVGAVDDRIAEEPKNCRLAEFSSRGPTQDFLPKPDLVAPGVNITSTRARRRYASKMQNKIKYSYTSMSGTSMATPVVAGVAALLLQQNPTLSVTELREQITANTVLLPAELSAQGSGLIQLTRS